MYATESQEIMKGENHMDSIRILQECKYAAIEARILSRQIDQLAMIRGSQMENPGRIQGLIDRLTITRDSDIHIVNSAEMIINQLANSIDRIIIHRHYFDGVSDYAIADELEKSQGWVNNRRKTIEREIAQAETDNRPSP